MDVNVNFNNKQKHWILVLIDKLKSILGSITGFFVRVFKSIGIVLKKFFSYLKIIIIIASIIAVILFSVDFYMNTYLPHKRLNTLLSNEIRPVLFSENDSIRCECAYSLLRKDGMNWEKYEGHSFLLGYDYYGSNMDYYREAYSDSVNKYCDIALSVIESSAYAGNARSQTMLGSMYLYGRELYHVDEDVIKSTYWYNEAAKQGFAEAYNNLGMAYREGRGVNKNIKKAIEFLKKGAEAGESYAQSNYGDFFVEGVKIKVGSHKEEYTTMTPQFDNEYIRRYRTDDYRTVYVKARTVDDSLCLIPKDIEQAKFWWKKAAAQGNESAKNKLQKIYE
jgi:hypothetical protein